MRLRGGISPVPILVLGLTLTPNLAAKTLSVCEAFDRISLLDGKKVSVRGVWVTNIETNGIFPYRCSSPQKSTTGRLVAIDLKVPQRNANLEAAWKEQDKVRGSADDLRQIATFHGTIHQASGTGHLNQYTLEMSVDRITKLKRVKRRPTSASHRGGDLLCTPIE